MIGAAGAAFVATPAAAQTDDSVLVRPAIPEGFDRGRNVSVNEKSRADYDPLGIHVGTFNVFPSMGLGLGATSNVLLTPVPAGDGFVTLSPQVTIRSDWSRHSLEFRGSSVISRYFTVPRRNNENYDLGALGQLDVSSAVLVNAEAQYAQMSENPDSGALSSSLLALSVYRRRYLRLGATYQSGQGRAIFSYDNTHFDFSNIPQAGGASFDQSDRNRTINRVSAQLQYAPTPSFYLYVQGTYGRTDYDRLLLSGAANRDSESYRLLGGVSIDLAGLLRGQLGIGYAWRNYDSPIYPRAAGLSVEGKLEYFPTELTTFTLQLARSLEDSSIGATNAYFDNRISLRVDHEALRNLLLGAEARYSRQNYVNVTGAQSGYAFSMNARYLATHSWSVDGKISFTRREASVIGSPYSEARGEVGVRWSL